jgi:hypothetical protein
MALRVCSASHLIIALGLAIAMGARPVAGQVLEEDFNNASATGGGEVLSGSGSAVRDNWDDALQGEKASASTSGNARLGSTSASAALNAGVGASGGGILSVADVSFELLRELFNGAGLGSGGGVFLAGNGTPDTFNFTLNWDDAIEGEGAFAGTFDGAILNGAVSAQTAVGGGLSGSAGEIVVDDVNIGVGNWFAGLQFGVGPFPGASPFFNPGFESPDASGGDLPNIQNWTSFGAPNTRFVTQTVPPNSGLQTLKMFGPFDVIGGGTGVQQAVPAQPGDVYEAEVYSRRDSSDPIGAGNFAVMRVEFLDAGMGPVGGIFVDGVNSFEVVVANEFSPANIWVLNTLTTAAAPAGTAFASMLLIHVQGPPSITGGAVFLDDASFGTTTGTGSVNLAEFSLSAEVLGLADGPAGEVLGDYQLRLEDTDGDRLIFHGCADGNWNAIGGPLSTAIEADFNGVPTPGVFNANSDSFVAVVAFDNDAGGCNGLAWGTGGTLRVDNLVLTNSNSINSDWTASLFWDELALTGLCPDLSRLFARADVSGDMDGSYRLSVEGIRVTFAGLDEPFTTVVGGGDKFIDAGTNGIMGAVFDFSTDWDAGIEGEAAFGGTVDNAGGFIEILPGGGFTAIGEPTAGNDGMGGGQIIVEGVFGAFGLGDTWFAGLEWGNQGLASSDLSQVELSALVRGTARSGGGLGNYEFRIEDAQGDRMYFTGTANGTWQPIGGMLNSATYGDSLLPGGGNGQFDLDSPSYTVVLAFNDPTPPGSWQFGGSLEIDDLFLTAVEVRQEIGRVEFDATANGAFQTVGGLLTQGVSNLGDFDEKFTAASGAGGLFLAGPNPDTGNWDTGIEGESAFFFTFDGAVSNDGTTVQSCASCGVNGGQGAELIVNDVAPNAGSWVAGIFFAEQRADLSGDLSQVFLTAAVQGIADTGAGQIAGSEYVLRIEDEDLTSLVFRQNANGSFQTIGGALIDADTEQIGGGDGVFNRNQGTYTVTLLIVGTTTNWGTGGTLHVDDLFLSGIGLDDADLLTVRLAMVDGVSSWGSDGQFSVDNLLLTAAGNDDGDGDVDLRDAAAFFNCLSNGILAGCECADLNGDGSLTLDDHALFTISFGGF